MLRHAFLNSYYQTGLRNLMDVSILRRTEELAQGEPALRTSYFAFLALIIVCYALLATLVKKLYIRRYGEWL